MFFLAPSGLLSGLFAIGGILLILYLPLYFAYERLHAFINYRDDNNSLLHLAGVICFKLFNLTHTLLLLCKVLLLLSGIKLLCSVLFAN